MALVDDVKIRVKAGDGGDGGKMDDGGDGGRGGSIYFQATSNVSDLGQFRFQKEIEAPSGENGMSQNCSGKSGEDIYVLIPRGTKIINEQTEEVVELIDEGNSQLIAKGGRGGIGRNNYNPEANNRRVRRIVGEEGQALSLHLILNLIADVGLIGLPNAGKSSLLDALTNASPKIGSYPFTTLEPNLGVLGKVVIADIPGLIEGASSGKGLGVQFLKHIEKTKMLMHCIDASEAEVVKVYQTVRKEFEEYSLPLLEKEEIILLTKIDLITPEQLQKQIKALGKTKRKLIPVSIFDQDSLDALRKMLLSLHPTGDNYSHGEQSN